MSIGNFIKLLCANKVDLLENSPSFEDDPNEKKPFKSHYQQYIVPRLQEFEKKRLSSLEKVRKRTFLAIPVCCLILAIDRYVLLTQNNLTKKDFEFIIGGTLALITLIHLWVSAPIRKYNSSVKSIIFPDIFSFFGNDYTYKEKPPLSVSSLRSSLIIPSFDMERTEDYIRGSYSDVSIEIMETELIRTGRKHSTTIFNGIIILLEMNKKFSGNTVVKKDEGKIGNLLHDTFNGLENVKLEDPVFEKQFEVYSSDQIEARYLLTTSFMERVLKLSELFIPCINFSILSSPSSTKLSFYNNRLLIMIPSLINRFETSCIFKPATFIDDTKSILSEMSEIFQIIDILKLNQKIGI